ncbi:hypothetical protein F5887DRAFT_926300 [Amanita rubescens]|nr:hypothetical protein F5887DRAFT_926300 [Amanita rubescens]
MWESYHAWLASQLSDHAGYDVAWVTCGWLRGSGTRNTQGEAILTPTADLHGVEQYLWDKQQINGDWVRWVIPTPAVRLGRIRCTGEERERCLSGINCPAKPDAVWADVRQAGRGGQQRVGTQADTVRFGWIHGLGNLRLAERRCATYLNNKA